jgi:hypothetical protein
MNLGYLLYEMHIFALVAFIFVFYARPAIRKYMFLAFLPFFFMHVAGVGCPMTKIEKHYHQEDITIIDPFLHMFQIYPSFDNRKTFQAWFSSVLVLWMIVLLLK